MPQIITLCGSTKFKEAYQFMNSYLTMRGFLVFSVAMWSHADKDDGWEPKHGTETAFGPCTLC